MTSTFVEIIRGLGIVLFIMVIAGGVAYVGDRVGHQVGRRRLTLFGIRPRYTSTIVAIATGMVIAFVVTLGAILASQNVRIAFFRLSSLNTQIALLQSRETELEGKITNGRLVVPTGTLMTSTYASINQSDTPDQRMAAIKSYYDKTVAYINAYYPRLGLRPYKVPPDIDHTLGQLSTSPTMLAELAQGNVLLLVYSDQNLFANDPIHFEINATPDIRRFVKGQPIAQLRVPGGANANLAISQLESYVTKAGLEAGLPMVLASYVQPTQILPALPLMQQMIQKRGTYYMTAYATVDIYPHTGAIPIVIALTQTPLPTR